MDEALDPAVGDLNGCSVLVVEDDFLIGDALSDVLRAAGATVVGPVGWLDEAIDLLDREDTRVDVAVLDVDLHGTSSYRIADRLAVLGVPFVFTTGYSSDAVSAAYRDHPRVQKPLNGRLLLGALGRCLVQPGR